MSMNESSIRPLVERLRAAAHEQTLLAAGRAPFREHNTALQDFIARVVPDTLDLTEGIVGAVRPRHNPTPDENRERVREFARRFPGTPDFAP